MIWMYVSFAYDSKKNENASAHIYNLILLLNLLVLLETSTQHTVSVQHNIWRSRALESLSEFSTLIWYPNLITFKTLMNVSNGDYAFFKPRNTFINECFVKLECIPIQ